MRALPFFQLIVFIIAASTQSLAFGHNRCLEKLNHFLISNQFLEEEHSIGHRGLLIPDHLFDKQLTLEATLEHGLLEWDIRIFHAASVEEARHHDASIENPTRKGLYIIGPESFPTHALSHKESIEIFNRYGSSTLTWFYEGHTRYVPANLVLSYFQFNDHDFVFNPNEPQHSYLSQKGWFFPKKRGVIFYEDLKTSKSILKYAQQLHDAGYKFTFNKHFNEALDQLRQQRRKNQQDIENRYAVKDQEDSAVMQNLIQLHQLGKAYSTEIIDPEGHLVAGNIFFRAHNYVSSDTVFYKEDYSPPEGLSVNKQAVMTANMVKVSNWVLVERLAQEGIPFLDIQVVSNINKDTRGTLIDVSHFLQLREKHTPAQLESIDFHSDWIPPSRRNSEDPTSI